MFPLCDNCPSVHSDPEENFQPFTPSGLDIPTNPVVTFLSPVSSLSKIPSNPASPDDTPASSVQPTSNSTTTIPDGALSLSTGLQFSISFPEDDHPVTTQELPSLNSLLSDVRPLLSRLSHLRLQIHHFILGRQHRCEYYTNRARKIKRHRFNHHSHYSPKPKTSTWVKVLWFSGRQEFTLHNKSLPSQRLVVSTQALTSLPR